MFELSERDKKDFEEDGYIIVRGLFEDEEIGLLKDQAKNDKDLDNNSFTSKDDEGGKIRLALWNYPGNDIYGRFVRSRRMVDTMEALLGDEVYHYHSKMILKGPKVGGAWDWHQDYGYWYDISVLFPDLASVMVAVDKANKENGCLQVLKGSHKMGRINHGVNEEQMGADMERVNQAMEVLERVYVELEPGDALFFHSNLLHRSDQNHSDNPRWAMISCYNTKHNTPYKKTRHASYTPLEIIEDSELKMTPEAPVIQSGDWMKGLDKIS